MRRSSASASTRERLTQAAGRVLYDQGIHRTGVDELVAAADLSKPTLYAYFESKDDLVLAVVKERSERRKRELLDLVESTPGGAERRLKAIFEEYAEVPRIEGFRGCPLVNSAVEAPDAGDPIRAVAREYKEWTRALLTRLAREARLGEPEELAAGLMLLIEGANVAAYVERRPSAGDEARRAAERLIAFHRSSGEDPAEDGR